MTPGPFDLSGKVAIVTGGNGGIGLGMAQGLADAGANIAVVGRNETKSAAAVAALGARGVKAVSVTADVTDPAAVTAMVEFTLSEFAGSISWSTTPASISARRRTCLRSMNGTA